MPKFVIERDLPGAGDLTEEDLRGISATSNKVIVDLGPDISWQHSYVTDDKIYCVYIAADEDVLYEHARCGGFPINKISKIATVIDPASAEGAQPTTG